MMFERKPDAICPDCGGRAGLSLYGEVWCVADCHLRVEEEPDVATSRWMRAWTNLKWTEMTRSIDELYVNGRTTINVTICGDEHGIVFKHPIHVRTDDVHTYGGNLKYLVPDTVVIRGGECMERIGGALPTDEDLDLFADALDRMGR